MALSINLDGQSNTNRDSLRSNRATEKFEVRISPNDRKLNSAKKPASKKKKFFMVLLVLLVVSCGGALIFYKRIQQIAQDIGIDIKTTDLIQSVISNEKPQLERDSTGKRTNVLLVGIDTREFNQGLQNTDTIIVASYNHDTNETVMISIPRDNYAEIPGEGWFIKINGIFNQAEQTSEGSGMETLQEVVEEYTGLEIQYYGMVDIKAFTEIIDTVGGVDIYVENSFTDYMYPAPNDIDFDPVSFEKGAQTMNGATALKFSRSRQSQGPEGNDFARARRQQKVIEAVKDKVLSSETLLNPNKVLDIMNSLQDHIRVSDISVKDIEAGIELLKGSGATATTYTFVMDPSAGGSGLLKTGVVPDAYSIGPILGLGEYEDLHAYINAFLLDPALYEANPTIYIYDTGLGYYEAFDVANELVEEYPFITIIYQGTLLSGKTGTVVYDNSSDQRFESIVNRLSASLEAEIKSKPSYISTSLNNEDIVILLGSPEVAEEVVTQ